MTDRQALFLSVSQLRELDRRAAEEWHIPVETLMERAGKAAARETLDLLESRRIPPPRRVFVLCGSGQNGGDGFAAARFLAKHAEISVISMKPVEFLKGETRHQAEKLTAETGIAVRTLPDPETTASELAESSVVLDALAGTGFKKREEGVFDQVVSLVNESGKPVVSVDVPSGLDADTGIPPGKSIRAVRTVTFAAMKRGFMNPESREWTGEISVYPIGFPEVLLKQAASF